MVVEGVRVELSESFVRQKLRAWTYWKPWKSQTKIFPVEEARTKMQVKFFVDTHGTKILGGVFTL